MTANTPAYEVVRLLEQRRHEAEPHVRFDWLTNRVPTDSDTRLPPLLKYRLIALHAHLGGDWFGLQSKRGQRLRIDVQVDDSTLIELDTKQHFSSARLATFHFYDGMEHGLDLDRYRGLCSQYCEVADRYQHSREAAGFAFPGGRIAQRAYFDACKDLLAAPYGYRLIRIPIPDGELTSEARRTLRVLF